MAESQKNQTEKENIVELKTNIYLLSIIGEVEGHESLGERTKATRYEHILPALARAEEDKRDVYKRQHPFCPASFHGSRRA